MDKQNNKIKVERKINKGWIEWNKINELKEIKSFFGKYQYIYSSVKGEISLIYLDIGLNYNYMWEIYCVEGELIEYLERFKTKKDAVVRIKELLR